MDLSQFAVDSLVVAAVFILMNLVGKPLIEAFLKPDAPAHDVTVQAVAVLLGVVGIFLDHGFPATSDGHSWLLLVVSGILSGASAIGVYHVTKTSTGTAGSTIAAPSATDLATALSAALGPLVNRPISVTVQQPPVPTPKPTPIPTGTLKQVVDGMNSQTATPAPAPSPSPEPPAPADRPAPPPSA